MSNESAAGIARSRSNWRDQHREMYLQSSGARGHVMDFTEVGGHAFTTHCLIRLRGRRSGATRITSLIYGDIGGEVVIVASRGWRRPSSSTSTRQKSPTKACPMVWTHRSGRKSLLLGATADYVIGLSVEESCALLARLRDWLPSRSTSIGMSGNWATCSSGTTPAPCTVRCRMPPIATVSCIERFWRAKSPCSETWHRNAGGHQRRRCAPDMGEGCLNRGHRPRRRGCGSAWLPPYDVQRAHRPALVRNCAARCSVLGSACHVRLCVGSHETDPARHHDACARLTPSAGDRKAVRHTGSR